MTSGVVFQELQELQLEIQHTHSNIPGRSSHRSLRPLHGISEENDHGHVKDLPSNGEDRSVENAKVESHPSHPKDGHPKRRRLRRIAKCLALNKYFNQEKGYQQEQEPTSESNPAQEGQENRDLEYMMLTATSPPRPTRNILLHSIFRFSKHNFFKGRTPKVSVKFRRTSSKTSQPPQVLATQSSTDTPPPTLISSNISRHVSSPPIELRTPWISAGVERPERYYAFAECMGRIYFPAPFDHLPRLSFPCIGKVGRNEHSGSDFFCIGESEDGMSEENMQRDIHSQRRAYSWPVISPSIRKWWYKHRIAVKPAKWSLARPGWMASRRFFSTHKREHTNPNAPGGLSSLGDEALPPKSHKIKTKCNKSENVKLTARLKDFTRNHHPNFRAIRRCRRWLQNFCKNKILGYRRSLKILVQSPASTDSGVLEMQEVGLRTGQRDHLRSSPERSCL
ncbi:hypothetical protein F5884DRAFT_744423 [Xylogone sp. PMI_703]|nr:hypothetical protein F5884DRAFT_744423 [Xylogone sp. PMI_703]